ncbi:hypothetical protein [Pollutimonas bauzanensis]|uniref:Transmembrane protein n=1 Tax=Pollutimonas bauzanensis TaxID=658167 RepID=A0A1M5MIH3_9BURK|nr:hypothetical protein [Pollutimonas bauzanensis]SHG76729.1 hypothetical protein SAMN04488135_101225 [Pollutimonas bauzanensis]
MNSNQINPSPPASALASTLALGFKFLAWINSMGVLAILSFGMGLIQTDLAPQWLRLPLAIFLAGLVLSALGLLWSYPLQASLLNQLVSGHARRTHWIPLFCTMVAYSLSLLAFVCGCWFTLGLASMAYQAGDDAASSEDQGVAPSDQLGEEQEFIYDAREKTVRFSGAPGPRSN